MSDRSNSPVIGTSNELASSSKFLREPGGRVRSRGGKTDDSDRGFKKIVIFSVIYRMVLSLNLRSTRNVFRPLGNHWCKELEDWNRILLGTGTEYFEILELNIVEYSK